MQTRLPGPRYRPAGVRIHHRGAETSGALVRVWNCRRGQASRDPPLALVIDEEELLVLKNRRLERTAECSAKLILLIDRFLEFTSHRVLRRQKRADGVERSIPEIFPRAAVELAGAASGRDVHYGADDAAIFGAVVICHDFEFAQRVRRRLNGLVGESLVVGSVKVVVEPVQDEVIQFAALAVHVKRRVAARQGLVLEEGLSNAWNQERQIRIGAAVEREVDNLTPADDLSTITRIRFKDGGGARDGNAVARSANLQNHVDALARAYGDGEAFGTGHFEAGEFSTQLIFARLHGAELVISLVIGSDGLLRSSCQTGEYNSAFCQHGTAMIAQRAQNAGRIDWAID